VTYPHERSLVQTFAGRPFALLGVNSDPEPRFALDAITSGRVNWRSWLDGSPFGPIAMEWEVIPWPAMYLIDAEGVIRYKQVGRALDTQELDDAIEALLREAESGGQVGPPTRRPARVSRVGP
jgi:hypothetical protein